MSDLESLWEQLCSYPASDRVTLAERTGVSVSLIQDFIFGHFCPDEELAARIAAAAVQTADLATE